jgi:hypothetical protein
MIFLLTRKGPTGWDRHFGFTVIASSKKEARALVQARMDDAYYYDEWHDERFTWSDPKLSTCERLLSDGDPRIVLTSFRAG